MQRVNVPPVGRRRRPTVVERGELATPLWGRNFDDVGRCRAVHEGDTEAENESTSDELVDARGGSDDCSPNANDQATHEHADTPTEAVPGRGRGRGQFHTCTLWWRDRVVRARASEERANNTTDVVHGEDDTGSWILGLTSANRSEPEHIDGCTLAEIGAVCKAVKICLHAVDSSPKEQGRGALGSNSRGKSKELSTYMRVPSYGGINTSVVIYTIET